MEPTLIFNLPNCLYWVSLALVIAIQGVTIGEIWSENRRWIFGVDTLFGSSLVMVYGFGWQATTWAGLLILVLIAYGVRIDACLMGNLWSRRESHRWTLRYFLAFLVAIPFVVLAGWDIVTWILMLISLGVCGAVKVGREAYQNSRRAQELRQQTVISEDPEDGL